MDEYKSNSDKARSERSTPKKVEAVVSEPTQTYKKKGQKFTDVFIADNATNVGSYIFLEVVVPAVKRVISDIVTTSLDMFFYGDANRSKKNSTTSKYSYQQYYNQDSYRDRPDPRRNNNLDYDNVLFKNRGDAEAVLDTMNDIISQFGMVSVADFYDIANYPNDNYTLTRYGWTNIGGAQAVRVRDGYVLKLPRPIPLN